MEESRTRSDAPVTGTAEDRYGYDPIATSLARSILAPGKTGSPLIESLLLPVAAIMDEYEARSHSWPRKGWQKLRNAPASPLAKSLIGYAQKTSGRLAPLAELGGNFVPGMGDGCRRHENRLKTGSLCTQGNDRTVKAPDRNGDCPHGPEFHRFDRRS